MVIKEINNSNFVNMELTIINNFFYSYIDFVNLEEARNKKFMLVQHHFHIGCWLFKPKDLTWIYDFTIFLKRILVQNSLPTNNTYACQE